MNEHCLNNEYSSRIATLSSSVGNVEFHVLFGVNGSSDRIVKHPGERISAYAEPIYMVANLLDGPRLDRLVEANGLGS